MLAEPSGEADARPDRITLVPIEHVVPEESAIADYAAPDVGLSDQFELLPPVAGRLPPSGIDAFSHGMIEGTPSLLSVDEDQPTFLPQAEPFDVSVFAGTTDVIAGESLSCDSCGDVFADGTLGCGCGATSAISNDWTPWQVFHAIRPRLNFSFLDVGKRFRESRTHDRGIGYERVMFAPNVLDTAIGTPHFGIRYQIDSGLQTPDRAEYYWAANPVGPGGDARVNTRDLTFRLALGNEKAMAFTQYTLRSLDPENAGNTTGMGDMVIGAQALMVDGKRTKVASIFRTYLATGPAQRGLGTGHTSLEPGVLLRHCTSPETYWFGELKYWIPIGGIQGHQGDVLSTGIGASSIAAESDVFAFIPTLEMRTLTFLFGQESVGPGTRRIDGDTAVELYPGARFVLGPRRDGGLLEFGFSPGVTIADSGWFDTRIVFDIRLVH